MAIIDTMNNLKNDISTVCVGIAASMAADILSSGKKGKRLIMKNAEVMIHQPLGGAEGQATDIAISAKRHLENERQPEQNARRKHWPAPYKDRQGRRTRLLHGRRRGQEIRHHRQDTIKRLRARFLYGCKGI